MSYNIKDIVRVTYPDLSVIGEICYVDSAHKSYMIRHTNINIVSSNYDIDHHYYYVHQEDKILSLPSLKEIADYITSIRSIYDKKD